MREICHAKMSEFHFFLSLSQFHLKPKMTKMRIQILLTLFLLIPKIEAGNLFFASSLIHNTPRNPNPNPNPNHPTPNQQLPLPPPSEITIAYLRTSPSNSPAALVLKRDLKSNEIILRIMTFNPNNLQESVAYELHIDNSNPLKTNYFLDDLTTLLFEQRIPYDILLVCYDESSIWYSSYYCEFVVNGKYVFLFFW